MMLRVLVTVLTAGILFFSPAAKAEEDINLETLTCKDLVQEINASETDGGTMLLIILAYHRGQLNDPVIPMDDASWDAFGETIGTVCGNESMQQYTVMQVLREMSKD